MKSKIIYWLVYGGMSLVALLPFRVMYLLSDFIYFWLRFVFRYRLKVVRHNLALSFPEKSEEERRHIETRFYHYLCDYMLEDVKLLRITLDELCHRMRYQQKELFLEMLEKHGGIILMIPHYANYEWIIGMGAIMKPEDIPVQVYKPMRDKSLNEFFKHIRGRFGGYNVPKHSTARELVKLRREGKKMVVGLITDQWPSGKEKYWTTFLGNETAFITGADRIARLMNFPVFYCELKKERRGYCDVEFDLLTEFPKETEDGAITEMFAHRLEQTIRREPAYWLWSHKRWKCTRAQAEAQFR